MKHFSLSCVATLLLGTLLVMSGCKKYDSDIDEINARLTSLEQTVNAIKSEIASGVIIKNVTPVPGGIQIALSNGNTYTITNGKDGQNGRDGKDGSVITIGENGNWFIDGVDTGKQAVGKNGKDGIDGKDGQNGKDGIDGKDGQDGKDGIDGKDGQDGQDGQDGKDGIDGKDGQDAIIWTPNEDGYWHYIDPITGEDVKSDQKWLTKEYITAVYSKNTITFYNVEGAEGGIVEINLLKVSAIQWVPQASYSGTPGDNIKAYYLGGDNKSSYLLGALSDVKFRISPASMADKITIDDLELLVDEVATKGDKPVKASAKIVDLENLKDGEGTILLRVQFDNFRPYSYSSWDSSYDKYVTASLKFTNGDDEINSNLVNFYYYDEETEYLSPVYGFASESNFEWDIEYNIPWSTSVEDSKVTLFKDSKFANHKATWYLQTSDGKKRYPLNYSSELFGKQIKITLNEENPYEVWAYNVPAYQPVDVKDSYFKLTVPKNIDWETESFPTIEFKKGIKFENMYSRLQLALNSVFTIDGDTIPSVDYRQAFASCYIAEEDGPSYSIAEEIDVPWTYEKVSLGKESQQPCPEFYLGVFDVVSESDVKITEFMDEYQPYYLYGLKEDGTTDYNCRPAYMRLYMKNLKQQVEIYTDGGNYEWGKTYKLVANIDKEGVTHKFTATMKFGAAPANNSFASDNINLKLLASKPMTDSSDMWAKAFEGYKPYFKDLKEFKEVISGSEFTTKTYHISRTGDSTLVTDSKLDENLNALIAYTDVKVLGDKFAEGISFTTWYGQKLSFTKNLTVVAGEKYEIIPEQSYIKDGVAEAKGQMKDGIWTIENVDMTNFTTFTPAKTDEPLLLQYEWDPAYKAKGLSLNGKVLSYGNLETATRPDAHLMAKLYMKSEGGHMVELTSYKFIVKTELPIVLTAESFSYKYTPNVQNYINIMNGTTLADISKTVWYAKGEIKKDGFLKAFRLEAPEFKYAEAENKYYGVTFDFSKMTQKYADGTDAHLNLTLNDNTMTFQATDAEMKSDVTVTIPATITYAFGKVNQNITVVIKAKEK